MSKRKAIADYALIPGAAKIAGVARSTIVSAIERGEIETEEMADGTAVVSITEVERWKGETRQRGRPPKE